MPKKYELLLVTQKTANVYSQEPGTCCWELIHVLPNACFYSFREEGR